MTWRNKIDPSLKPHLEKQILEATKQKKAYKKAKDKATAQLWCAIANLSKQIFDLNLELDYLEKTTQKKKKRKPNK